MSKLQLEPVSAPGVSRQPGLGSGRVFYVNQTTGIGNNAANGIDPGTPFATIDYALSACSNWYGDYIYVIATEDGSEPAYPIDVDIIGVHIIGLSAPTPDVQCTINGGGQACMRLDADGNWCEIAGFAFHTTGAAAEGIQTAGCYGCWIHHCSFGTSAQGQGLENGIWQPLGGDGLPWSTIEDCIFSSDTTHGAVGITDYGIVGNNIGAYTRRNIFRGVPLGAIRQAGTECGTITDNYFFGPIAIGYPVGWAISLLGTYNGIIMNNHASQAGDNIGLNPYLDNSTGVIGTCTNAWGMNYSGQAVIAPAVS